MLMSIENKMFSFLVKGKWTKSSTWNTIVDPLNGEPFIKVAEIDETGIQVCLLISVQVSLLLFTNQSFSWLSQYIR